MRRTIAALVLVGFTSFWGRTETYNLRGVVGLTIPNRFEVLDITESLYRNDRGNQIWFRVAILDVGPSATIGGVAGNWVRVSPFRGDLIGWSFDPYLREPQLRGKIPETNDLHLSELEEIQLAEPQRCDKPCGDRERCDSAQHQQPTLHAATPARRRVSSRPTG